MGIAELEPRQLAPTVGTTGSGSTGSPASSPYIIFNNIQIAPDCSSSLGAIDFVVDLMDAVELADSNS
jgi:hypothetical protein